MSMRNTKGYGAKNPTYQFTGTKDEYIALLKKAIQWHLWEEKSPDYECSFCAFEGSGDKVLPESIRDKYGSASYRTLPRETIRSLRMRYVQKRYKKK